MKKYTLKLVFEGNKIKAIEALFDIAVKKKPKNWIVYSPDFKTFGYSEKSEEAALQHLKSALLNYFEVHFIQGTLEKALNEAGWSKEDGGYASTRDRFRIHPSDIRQRSFELHSA